MYYLKHIIVSFRSSLSFFCALLSLTSIVVLSQYGNDILLSSSTTSSSPISKILQAAAAISTTTSSSYSHSATITKIQLPGIIPNNNNNPSPISPPTFPTSPQASPSALPPAPPIIHNTRARPALGGPTLNDPNLKVQQIFTGPKL
jgi:hypothetical protein